jgi:hypothetical protein
VAAFPPFILRTTIESTSALFTVYSGASPAASPPGNSTTTSRSVGLKTV